MAGAPKRRLFKTLRELNGGPPPTSKEEKRVAAKLEEHGKPTYDKYKEVVKKLFIEAKAEIKKEEAV